MLRPKKSLGQHWLRDVDTLASIVAYAELSADDTVLEIGPGLGTLTEILATQSKEVVAVEFDQNLALELGRTVAKNHPNLQIINDDFLKFDLNRLPANYKVVANVPYYITSKIVEKLVTAKNKPSVIVLLVQKEVAERLAAQPGGDMSVLSVMAQLYAQVDRGIKVPAELFTPPPKVDSMVVVLRPHDIRMSDADIKTLFRVVKAGFSARRKKLHTALAGGLHLSVDDAKNLLHTAGIDSNLRAQELSIDDWKYLTKCL